MKVVAHNRRARFDYEILSTVDAGIMLSGQEAKSCRLGHVNVAGAYVSFAGGRPVLKHMKIAPYPFASGLESYDPERERSLLLQKREADELRAAAEQQGYTIVPLEVKAGRFIKVTLAVARGRKRADKRQRIRERETERRLREGRES